MAVSKTEHLTVEEMTNISKIDLIFYSNKNKKLKMRLKDLWNVMEKVGKHWSYSYPIYVLPFSYYDVVLRHTLPIFTGLGRCPIVSWDFAEAVSIFGPDALPVVHQ